MTSVQMPITCSYNERNTTSTMVSERSAARPGTPSFRIVSSPAVNPSPTFTDAFEEEDVLFEDVLSPKKLRLLSGYSNLAEIISLDLVVDTTESSLGSFGNYLPNIRELRLSGSKITTVRDLGTTLRSLQVLWMSRCGLQDLDGISSIGQLKELYLSYNEISDVSPLSMIDTLELVDVESNNVQTLDQVEFLCMCPCLSTLNLEGNPLTITMSSAELRKNIARLLPDLKYLDDQPLRGQVSELSTSSHKLLGNTGNLQSEMRVVNSSLKDSIADVLSRPKSARNTTRDDSSSPSPTPSAADMTRDHCSDLTQGAVICGPPSKLLTKMSRNAREHMMADVLEGISQTPPPPTLVAAWSDHPEDMLADWQKSRDWLTRELTIDNLHEESVLEEKQAAYEAALRETTRLSTPPSRLSRPTSSRSRTPPTKPSSRNPPTKPSSRSPVYDECVEVEERVPRRGEDRKTQRASSRDRKPRRASSRDRPADEPRTRDKGKQKLSKQASSTEFTAQPRRGSLDRLSKSLDSTNTRYRPAGLAQARQQGEMLSPTRPHDILPPTRALPTPPSAAKTMSSRFRRLKVSIEDQVAQQTTMDVLYSDKMPRPGVSRHNISAPRRSAS